jgi:hypothetical protein
MKVPSSQRLESLAKAAARHFEKETGWIPFLASPTPSTRQFDPPGIENAYMASVRGGSRVLELDGGLISVVSITVAGTTYVPGTDCWLKPANSEAKSFIEFGKPIFGLPQSISITGVWGFSVQVPDDAWLAILRLAAISAMDDYVASQTGGMEEWAEGDAREKYGESPMQSTINDFREHAASVIRSYRRVTVGV